jgi:hypothetical protein
MGFFRMIFLVQFQAKTYAATSQPTTKNIAAVESPYHVWESKAREPSPVRIMKVYVLINHSLLSLLWF